MFVSIEMRRCQSCRQDLRLPELAAPHRDRYGAEPTASATQGHWAAMNVFVQHRMAANQDQVATDIELLIDLRQAHRVIEGSAVGHQRRCGQNTAWCAPQ